MGSCIFNLLAVVGLAGVVSPLKGEGVTVIHLGGYAGSYSYSDAYDVTPDEARPLGRELFW